jgi:hypothetical protein
MDWIKMVTWGAVAVFTAAFWSCLLAAVLDWGPVPLLAGGMSAGMAIYFGAWCCRKGAQDE